MGKYALLIGVLLLSAAIVIFTFRWLNRETDDLVDVTGKHQDEVAYDNIADPDIIVVTEGDSLYHAPRCQWVGSVSRRMSREKAISLGFSPCPQCIEP